MHSIALPNINQQRLNLMKKMRHIFKNLFMNFKIWIMIPASLECASHPASTLAFSEPGSGGVQEDSISHVGLE
jgi:hypothetical protein